MGSPTDVELIRMAFRALRNSYSPYSKFRVGAALLTSSGSVFCGTNVENASYGLSMCAERVAVFKAVSEGHTSFVKMAVVSETKNPVYPCGACRQVLYEFSPGIELVFSGKGGEIFVRKLNELLPEAFGPGDLLPSRS
jgi:cytidine deaminase (EC 3.5.4.5)